MNRRSDEKIPLIAYTLWLLAAFFYLYEFFLRTFIGSLATQLIPDLHLTTSTFAVMGAAYYITYGLMQLSVGFFLQRYGERFILCFASFVCALSTFLFANATNFTLALISRLLMGFGSSFAFVALLMVAVKWFPKRYFGLFVGMAQFIGTLGPVLAAGPLVNAITSFDLGWRVSLQVIGLVGVMLGIIILLVMRNKPRTWDNDVVLLQNPYPLRELIRLVFNNKQAIFIALYSSMTYVSLPLLGAYWGSSYLQAHGISQHSAADIISLSWLGYGLGCPLLGFMSDFLNRRRPVLILAAIIGAIATSIITFIPCNHSIIYTILFFTLGLSASGASVGFAIIADNASVATKSMIIGLNNGVVCLFASVIPMLSSYLIHSAITQLNLDLSQPSAYTWGFALMPIVFILSVLLAVFTIKETYCRPQRELILLSY